MEQAPSNMPGNQNINTRVVDLNEVLDFTKQAWKANGLFLIKSMIPMLLPLAVIQYMMAAVPTIISSITVAGAIAGWMLSVILIPFGFGLALLLQAAVFGMNRPIKNVVLHGEAGIAPNESFFSQSKQSIFTLLLLSLATTVAVAAGTCMLIIPGIIVGVIAQPTGYLVATRGMGLMDAVKTSINVIKTNPLPILAYHLIFGGIATAIMIPCFIIVFGLYFALSLVSPLIGQLMYAALYPVMYVTIIPVFSFIIGTLYIKLIDDNTRTTTQFANNTPQQPGAGW